jgi:short-subunit dehydrogenase
MGAPFREKSVIVTGASLGIGREIALQLAGQGAFLTLASRGKKELDRVADQCRERGARASVFPVDVSNQDNCSDLIEHTISVYGRIDSLICNAGVGMSSNFEDLVNLSVIETLMAVNFWGAVYCAFFALPYLKTTKGRIAVVIAGGGKIPTPGLCGYGASKHALAGFFDSLRIELEGSGVSVTTAYPEWVATGISSRALKADGTATGQISTHEKGAISPDVCARKIIEAAAKRKRDSMSLRLRLGLILGQFAPGMIDRIASWAYS